MCVINPTVKDTAQHMHQPTRHFEDITVTRK